MEGQFIANLSELNVRPIISLRLNENNCLIQKLFSFAVLLPFWIRRLPFKCITCGTLFAFISLHLVAHTCTRSENYKWKKLQAKLKFVLSSWKKNILRFSHFQRLTLMCKCVRVFYAMYGFHKYTSRYTQFRSYVLCEIFNIFQLQIGVPTSALDGAIRTYNIVSIFSFSPSFIFSRFILFPFGNVLFIWKYLLVVSKQHLVVVQWKEQQQQQQQQHSFYAQDESLCCWTEKQREKRSLNPPNIHYRLYLEARGRRHGIVFINATTAKEATTTTKSMCWCFIVQFYFYAQPFTTLPNKIN